MERITKTNRLMQFEPNYLLLDGALWQRDMETALLRSIEKRSLYRGQAMIDLGNAGPYLFCAELGSDFAEWVLEKTWREPEQRRATWLYSESGIDTLRKHLRRFLRMKRETGGYLYFRFYDPWVLSVVLPVLHPSQLEEFFAQVRWFAVDDFQIGEKRIYTYDSELKTELFSLFKR